MKAPATLKLMRGRVAAGGGDQQIQGVAGVEVETLPGGGVHQHGVRRGRQAVHQGVQGFPGEIVAEEGHFGEVGPVDAQHLAGGAAPAAVQAGAVKPHPRGRLHARQGEVIADRDEIPQAALVACRRLPAGRVRAGGGVADELAALGQVQVGAHLVGNAVAEGGIQRGSHGGDEGGQPKGERDQQQHALIGAARAGELAQDQHRHSAGQACGQGGQPVQQGRQHAQGQQAQAGDQQGRQQEEQRVLVGVARCRWPAPGWPGGPGRAGCTARTAPAGCRRSPGRSAARAVPAGHGRAPACRRQSYRARTARPAAGRRQSPAAPPAARPTPAGKTGAG